MKRACWTCKIIVIVGPTASGKSALAVRLARRFSALGGQSSGWNGAEVISADSRQVYKGLDIGTGKITKKEMRGVPHHMLDVANPKRHFNVIRYVVQARRAIAAIARRGHVPIVCGGTGFYIDALLDDRVFPEVPPNYALRKKLEKKSTHELFAMLKKLAPRRAKTIDPKNPRRLIRAIEIANDAELTRKQKRGTDAEKEIKASIQSYNVLWIGLALPRKELKKKIAIRLFARISRGMITEAKKLHNQGLSWKRMEELGLEYRYLARHIKNQISKSKMIEKLQTEIWRYAKRQMTWFRHDKRIIWFQSNEKKRMATEIKKFLN